MPIEFYCSECYAKVITPDETGGKKGRCPNCGAIVNIPAISQSSQPATPPPAPKASPKSASADPFKPHEKTSGFSESVEKQFGFDQWEEKKEEQGTWGEDTEISYKMRKAIAREHAQNRLIGPAQTLITLAAVNLIVVALSIIGLTIYLVVEDQANLEHYSFWITMAFVVLAVVMLDSMMIFVGGNHMKLSRSYSMAYTGAVFALLPLNLLFFVTIPFGAWAISTLSDPKLAEGFKRR